MTLKTLEEHNNAVLERANPTTRGNGIECPNCKEELFDSSPNIALLSSPLQYQVHCIECNWKGTRY